MREGHRGLGGSFGLDTPVVSYAPRPISQAVEDFGDVIMGNLPDVRMRDAEEVVRIYSSRKPGVRFDSRFLRLKPEWLKADQQGCRTVAVLYREISEALTLAMQRGIFCTLVRRERREECGTKEGSRSQKFEIRLVKMQPERL